MRRISLMTMLLTTAGLLFFAIHEYVEVSVFNHAQAQATDPAVTVDTQTEGEDCGNGICHPTKTAVDLNNDTNLTREEIVARALRSAPQNKSQTQDANQ